MKDKVKNFKDLVKFLEADMKLKETLIEAAPKQGVSDDIDYSGSLYVEDNISYSDRLFKDGIGQIEYYFSQMLDTFDFNSETKTTYKNKMDEIKKQTMNDLYKEDNGNLLEIYHNFISKMRPNFVKDVGDSCKGYYLQMNSKLNGLIQKSESVNELLHVFHSYVVNNVDILQSLPVLKQKKGERNTYSIYGIEDNDVANQIFDNINVDQTKMGTTDIIALPDRVLMMVRDVGHATTLEIKKDKATGQYGVSYFIPKICNAEKVNQLQGVTKVDKNAKVLDTTNGVFQIEDENVGECIVNFIEKIPTDNDIPEKENDEEKINEANDESIINEVNDKKFLQPKTTWIERFKRWREKIKEIPDKAKKMINSLINHNNDIER